MKKIVICGGHLTPAQAVIDAIQKKDKNIKIIFFGRKYTTEGSKSPSVEFETIKKLQIKFYSINAGRLSRKFTRYTLVAIVKIPLGFIQSLYYLLLERPNLVVSFGGYLSPPAIFCAWLLGIPSVTHEQAVIPGLANKFNSLIVEKIFLGWPETQNFFPSQKVQVVGIPQRQAIFKTKAETSQIASFLKKAKNLIYITGGNQGSHAINNFIFKNLDIFEGYHVLHQLGTVNWQNDWQKAASFKRKNYLATSYVKESDIGAIFHKVKIVIARSGANTVGELVALVKPAILIPLPIAASQEQTHNAKILQKAKTAVIIDQEDLNRRSLKKALDQITNNYQFFQKNALILNKTLPVDAADQIVSYVINRLNPN